MFALKPDLLERWRKVEPPALRFLLRLWLDSLYVGTHVHWRLPPFSILLLGRLWSHWYPVFDHTRRARGQLSAIRKMAHRRIQADYFAVGDPPGPAADLAKWNAFFTRELEEDERHHEEIPTALYEALSSGDWTPGELYDRSCELLSLLNMRGVYENQLFLAVKNYVISASKPPPLSRLQELVDRYLSEEPPEPMVAYTRLVPTGEVFGSKSSYRKHWSPWFVADLAGELDELVRPRLEGGVPTDVAPDTFRFTRCEEDRGKDDVFTPFLVTVARRPAGMPELHRREALVHLGQLVREDDKRSTLALGAVTKFRPVGETDVYYHDTQFLRTGMALLPREHRPQGEEDAGVEWEEHAGAGRLYHNALDVLLEFPEEAMWHLMVAMETRWDSHYARLGDAYRWSLRTRLGGDIVAYAIRIGEAWSNVDFPPRSSQGIVGEWWEEGKQKDVDGWDHQGLRERLIESEDGDDESVVGLRLAEVCDGYGERRAPGDGSCTRSPLGRRCHTWCEVKELLALARGVRNTVAHEGFMSLDFYGAMLYLGRVACEAFIAGMKRSGAEPGWDA